MRILFILPRAPFPPDNGFKQRYSNLLRSLGSRNEVHVACFVDRENELSGYREQLGESVTIDGVGHSSSKPTMYLRAWLSPDPSEVLFLASESMAQLVDQIVARTRPDVIIAGDAALTQYVEKYDTVARVLDHLCDPMLGFERLKAISSVPRRWLYTLRSWKYAGFLRRVSRYYDRCISSSREDRDSIATAWPADRPIDIIPVGLEPERYPLHLAEPVPGRLIYPGAITYDPNRDAVTYFAREILPRIRARVPNAVLWVTGSLPQDGSEPKAEGLQYTGHVEDIRVCIASAWATVVPLRSGAGGTRLKLLESMALGTPLVSTAIGYEGIPIEDRKHLLAAETAETFAERCIELLGDAELRARLTRHARELFEARYNSRNIARDYESILTRLVER